MNSSTDSFVLGIAAGAGNRVMSHRDKGPACRGLTFQWRETDNRPLKYSR